ncbi:MAG TPA: outer membrane beta-barrel protein [Dyella sp.]|uniref:outer membrane beta-barrel protein n=1 Tax=Dyella sp. TaxID=1869338 RepID=UPI002F957FB3
MNKLLVAAVAVAMSTATASAFAGDFFVNGNLGRANWLQNRSSNGMKQENQGAAGQLRVGYRWNSIVDYGVEAGYAYLGANNNTVTQRGDSALEGYKLKSRGYLLGGNVNWNITDQWYVGGRAGWYRGRQTLEARPMNTTSSRLATGEYFGIGAGYNINSHFSIGLNVDRFRLPGDGKGDKSMYVNMTSIGGEFRF